MKPIIGISESVKGRVTTSLINAIKLSGGIPKKISKIEHIDGLIIPGGDKWHNEDVILLDYAIANNKPILGICMGMQLLVSYFNCDYYDNDKNKTLTKVANHNNTNHNVNIIKDSKLFNIINKDKIIVNSRHYFKVSKINKIKLKVSSLSDDNTIESIEVKNHRFAIGIQWHPENILEQEENLNIFKSFINKCQN